MKQLRNVSKMLGVLVILACAVSLFVGCPSPNGGNSGNQSASGSINNGNQDNDNQDENDDKFQMLNFNDMKFSSFDNTLRSVIIKGDVSLPSGKTQGLDLKVNFNETFTTLNISYIYLVSVNITSTCNHEFSSNGILKIQIKYPAVEDIKIETKIDLTEAINKLKGNTNNGGSSDTGGTETGLYLGIIGFNEELNQKPLSLLKSSSNYGFENFVNNLQKKDGTILYHAVNKGLDVLSKAELPTDIVNVSIVTFTDGLDLGSYRLNDSYDNGTEYLSAINGRIKNEKVKNLPISAYSIGIRGSDVTDVTKFKKNLSDLASTSDNAMEVTSMDEVKTKFSEIANSLTNVSTSQSIDLTIPAPEPGAKIRFTFDDISDAVNSEIYIEGIYKYSNGTDTLEDIVYHGLTSTSGSLIKGKSSGIKVTFSFSEIVRDDKKSIDAANLKQWSYIESTSTWQINSEFNPTEDTQTNIEKSSAAIILVLDCSSSLGSDFEDMKSAANEFINVLTNSISE